MLLGKKSLSTITNPNITANFYEGKKNKKKQKNDLKIFNKAGPKTICEAEISITSVAVYWN